MLTAKAAFENRQRAAHQRLGLAEPVRGLQQQRQVVEVSGDVRMLGAEARLVDGQRAPHRRLGLAEPVRGLQQLRQVVEVYGDRWMLGAEARLVDGQRAAVKWLGGGKIGAGLEVKRILIEQQRGVAARLAGIGRVREHSYGMRLQAAAGGPAAHVFGADVAARIRIRNERRGEGGEVSACGFPSPLGRRWPKAG